MTRLTIFILFGMSILDCGVKANEVVFICKNVNGTESEFSLKIDLDKKTMNKEDVVAYKNIEIYDDEIVARKLYKQDKIDNEIILRFNRITGNLMYRHFRSITLYDTANYLCNKKLI